MTGQQVPAGDRSLKLNTGRPVACRTHSDFSHITGNSASHTMTARPHQLYPTPPGPKLQTLHTTPAASRKLGSRHISSLIQAGTSNSRVRVAINAMQTECQVPLRKCCTANTVQQRRRSASACYTCCRTSLPGTEKDQLTNCTQLLTR